MAYVLDGAGVRRASIRALALVGTALGSSMVADAAQAQNISSNGSTDYSLTESGTRSGGPRTIDVTTSGGNITIDVGTINVENSTGTQGAGIAANNTGPGTVTIRDANVFATGTGVTYGVDARSTTGAIAVTNAGAVTSNTNNFSRGIYAVSAGGDITITSNEATGAQRGIFTGSNPAGAGTFFTTTTTTITSTTATATGTGNIGLNAIVGQGNRVIINSGTATNSNTAGIQGTAIFANSGAGGVLVNAGATNAFGQNQAALQVFSNGVVDVTSGAIRTTQSSDGLSIQTGTDLVVRSTSVATEGGTGSYGIVLGGNRGGGGFNGGPNGFAYTSANVTSGTITTAGADSYGIYATPNGAGSTIITSGAITTAGANATGIRVNAIGTGAITGTTTITSTGRLQTGGVNASGIQVTAGSGAVNIANTGQIVTTGQNSYGINVVPGSGATTITGTGSIATSGLSAHGIYLNPASGANTGAVSITSGPIAASGASAQGVWVINAGGPVTINASDVRTGTGAAIVVQQQAGATAPIAVTAGIVRSGATSAAINISSNGTTGSVTVSVADSVSVGAAVDARSVGAVSVTAGAVQTTGANATGLVAVSSGGDVAVNSTNLTSANRGIFAQGRDNATVVSGTLVSSNADFGIIARTSAADSGPVGTLEGVVNLTSGTLTATNVGLNAFGPRATINVNSGTVTTQSGTGIQAFGIDVNVTSGTINTGTFGIEAGMGTGAPRRGATVVNSDTINLVGTVAGATTGGISANGASVVVNSGTITASGLGNRFGISAQVPTSTVAGTTLPGTLNVTSGSITAVGNAGYGIQAITDSGALTVTSTGTITTSGTTRLAGNQPRYSAGIVAYSPAGAITIASNNISTQGAQADGIRVEAGSGNQGTFTASPNYTAAAVSVTTSGAIQTAGDTASGVNVFGGGGAVTIANSGTITTGGATSYGINVQPQGGATAITSNAVATGGAGATGIRVAGGTGAVTIAATNVTTSGAGAGGIDAATGGAATVTAATVQATAGTAILVNAGGAANVQTTSASGGGDGFGGVNVTGGTGVTLNVAAASSTGATGATRADAIFAEAIDGAINAQVGSASAQGANADAIRLVANGPSGAVTLGVTGTVSSAGGYGIFIDPPGAVNLTVASGATVAGALGGVDTTSGSNTIVNLGTISSTGGSAIVAAGATTLDNSGALSGGNGNAVQFGATNDIVILRTGATVTGAIQGGGGTDAARLIGSGTTATAGQTVATFRDFATLAVESGYWTAPASATPSTVAATTIAGGATLALTATPTGFAGYQTATITDNGDLVVGTPGGVVSTPFAGTTVSGSGTIRFTGAGAATLAGTNSLTNTGTNTVDAGATVLVTGAQGGNFVNNGTFQIGTGGANGTFTGNLVDNGTLIIDRTGTYNFTGALTGAGTFIKNGAGQVVFGTGYAFTGTTILNGGSIRLSSPVAFNTELDVRGTGTIDLSGQVNTIAELKGDSPAATVNIGGGSLTVNQASNTVFAGVLSGAGGSLIKAGPGTLNLTGANTYTGPTTINGGRLAVNGSITSSVTVAAGGTLGGAGTVAGNVTVANGGTWDPGNSPGTQNVTGNIAFTAGSTFLVEATPAGVSDRIVATGTATLTGGTVAVMAAAGTYAQLTTYNIITAAGGVTGQFANVTSNMAFLSPLLSYGATTVNLTLARNDTAFGTLAVGPNGLAVATAIAGRALGDPIFNAILFQPFAAAPGSFNQLSGELQATLPAVLVDGGRRVRELVLNRAAVREEGLGVWLDGVQSFARSRGQTGFARVRTNRSGVYGGLDYGSGDLRFGVSGGYFDHKVHVRDRASTADVDTAVIGGSIGYAPAAGRLLVLGGVTYAWHDIDTSRAVTVAGLPGTFAASSDADSTEVFAEVGYALLDGPVTVSPFVRYSHDWTDADGFAETGGTAALTLGRDKRSVSFATVGARFGGSAELGGGMTIEPKGSLSYEHGWGDLRDGRTAAFTGAGPAFTVTGVRLGRDTFNADLGADLVWNSGLRVGLSGFAARSSQWRDYGGKLTVGFRF